MCNSAMLEFGEHVLDRRHPGHNGSRPIPDLEERWGGLETDMFKHSYGFGKDIQDYTAP